LFRQFIGADVTFPLYCSFHILNRQSGSKG
jgi:hypothetical protein